MLADYTDDELIEELQEREAPIFLGLDEFSTDEIIEDLEKHGYTVSEGSGCGESLDSLYEARRCSSPDFDAMFAAYCWQELGRIL